jgi:hypothetical protein
MLAEQTSGSFLVSLCNRARIRVAILATILLFHLSLLFWDKSLGSQVKLHLINVLKAEAVSLKFAQFQNHVAATENKVRPCTR